MRLAEALERDRNNFDLVRLIAALMVMYGHSFLLVRDRVLADLLGLLSGWSDNSGSLAVHSFFLISGLLISASYDRQRSLPRFALLRFARIWPSLAAFTLLSVFAIGPLLTAIPLSDYFADIHPYTFLKSNLTLFGGVWMVLPGLFPDNPAPTAYNFTIWTLAIEAKCYLLVAILGVAGIVARPLWLALAAIAAMAAVLVGAAISTLPLGNVFEDVFAVRGGYTVPPATFFAVGMLAYAGRDFIRVGLIPVVAMVLLTTLLRPFPVAWQVSFYVAFVMIVLWLCAEPRLFFLRPRNDYSYGTYLYGFTVQQVFIMWFPAWPWWGNVLASVPVTLLIAAASWHLIERPSLRFARRFTAPAPQAVVRVAP